MCFWQEITLFLTAVLLQCIFLTKTVPKFWLEGVGCWAKPDCTTDNVHSCTTNSSEVTSHLNSYIHPQEVSPVFCSPQLLQSFKEHMLFPLLIFPCCGFLTGHRFRDGSSDLALWRRKHSQEKHHSQECVKLTWVIPAPCYTPFIYSEQEMKPHVSKEALLDLQPALLKLAQMGCIYDFILNVTL